MGINAGEGNDVEIITKLSSFHHSQLHYGLVENVVKETFAPTEKVNWNEDVEKAGTSLHSHDQDEDEEKTRCISRVLPASQGRAMDAWIPNGGQRKDTEGTKRKVRYSGKCCRQGGWKRWLDELYTHTQIATLVCPALSP